jgi:hypothetical protein
MPRILLGLLVVVLASPVNAQNRLTLDDPIGEFRIRNPLPPCGIGAAVRISLTTFDTSAVGIDTPLARLGGR